MEYRYTAFYRMSEKECKEAEESKQQESIEYFRWFPGSGISHFPVCPVTVIKWQQWLDNTCYPEKAKHPGNEQEHFPFSYFCTGQVAFSKYNTYNKEDNEPWELVDLKTWNIID